MHPYKAQKFVVHCVTEPLVDSKLDSELCQLLQICFPNESKFKNHRDYNEMPQMRWILRFEGELIAHIAAHEKILRVGTKEFRFCGISEVCIIPTFRKRRLLPQLLNALELYYAKHAYDFSILLGPSRIYQPHGYRSVDNVYFPEQSDACAEFAMYKPLRSIEWPQKAVAIEGAYF